MIGVVVWSSAAREKAIIWCEDQSTLAYLQGRVNFADPVKWPQAGDLVELDSVTVGDLRHARNVSILSEQAALHLPQILATFEAEPCGPQLRLVTSHDIAPAGSGQATSPRHSDPVVPPFLNRAQR